jgi:hypothetical protein
VSSLLISLSTSWPKSIGWKYEQQEHHIQEVLTVFPSLQFGMDANAKFTNGPNGVECTMELNG